MMDLQQINMLFLLPQKYTIIVDGALLNLLFI